MTEESDRDRGRLGEGEMRSRKRGKKKHGEKEGDWLEENEK